MHRKTFLRNTALLAGGALVLRENAFARVFGQEEGSLRMIRNSVGYYTERGGTIGLHLDRAGATVIDSQFPDTAPHFIAEVQKQPQGDKLHLLLNTHHHGDHTGGNIAFKDKVVQVIAHENSLRNQRAVAEKANTAGKQLFPDRTFTDGLTLDRSNEKIKAYYFGAAHTNGDAVYHFEKANVAHLGDLVANRRHPYVDRSAGASVRNWDLVLASVLKSFDKDTIYIFGHAGDGYEVIGKEDDVVAFREYINRVIDYTVSSIKKGITKEEYLKAEAIPGAAAWGKNGIERPLNAAWDELTEVKQ